jgi:hypothetical protein
VCRWCAIYLWKTFDEGYNFALNFIAIEGLHAKLCTPKTAKVLVVGILGFPFEKLKIEKNSLDVAPVESFSIYYMGKGGGFPQV